MKTIARWLLLFTGLLLLAHYLPQGYWLLAAKKRHVPIVFYSCVEKRFLFYRYGEHNLQYVDVQGKTYDREGFERLLPLDNYMQLLRDGRLPKEIDGVALAPSAIRLARLNLKIKPVALDSPVIPLYPLLEAESGRVRLEMPEDFMRLGSRVEFVDAQTNLLARDKSDQFTQAFAKAGFVFPPTTVGGNPTTLKPYDEGYFLADATGTTFQLRQVRGQPDLHRVADLAATNARAEWQTLKPRYIHVQEQEAKEVRAIVIDPANRALLVIGPDYRLIPIPFKRYDPATMNLVVRGDLLNRLIIVNSDDYLEAVVLNRDYSFVDRYTEDLPRREATPAGKLARAIFPFTVEFDDSNSGYLGFFPAFGSSLAILVNLLCALGLCLWWLARRQFRIMRLPDILLVAIGGLYGLLLVAFIPQV
jgi:hypothetical protein